MVSDPDFKRIWIPEWVKKIARPALKVLHRKPTFPPSVITQPTGRLKPGEGPLTLVVGVDHRFNQNKPDAGMVCRLGMCRGFEQLGIPYLLTDVRDLAEILPSTPNPICWLSEPQYDLIDRRTLRTLRNYPLFVWLDPWFAGSERFYRENNYLDYIEAWTVSRHRKVLDSQPRFGYFADVESRMCFHEEWIRRGMRVGSIPLACDTTQYHPQVSRVPEFEGIRMAFVGGYWPFKAIQLDKYLRPFEEELIVYGYSPWPYKGYRGLIPPEAEPSLYHQALLSPTINEPQVVNFVGLNERVFKVLGSGGATIVDAIPAYRELFSEDELPIPRDEKEFTEIAREMLRNKDLRQKYSRCGRDAVISRHTYVHRARSILSAMDLDFPEAKM